MSNAVEIIKVEIKDVTILSALAKQTFYDTFTGTCTPADMQHFLELYYNENVLALELEDKNLHCYFAEVNGQIAGYCLFAENNNALAILKNKNCLELKRLYILTAYQGKKVAQKLMDFFIETALKKKYDYIFLGVWEYNYKAQNFYKKYGLLPTDCKHGFPIGNTPQTDIYFIKEM